MADNTENTPENNQNEQTLENSPEKQDGETNLNEEPKKETEVDKEENIVEPVPIEDQLKDETVEEEILIPKTVSSKKIETYKEDVTEIEDAGKKEDILEATEIEPIRNDLVYKPPYDEEPLFKKVVDSVPSSNVEVPIIQIRKTDLKHISQLKDAVNEKQDDIAISAMKIRSIHFSSTIVPKEIPSRVTSSSSSTIDYIDLISREEIAQRHLDYLMRLLPSGEYYEATEAESYREEEKEEEEEIEENGKTVAMRNAQRYLRVHKIFELFQFMTSHLLSACPGK